MSPISITLREFYNQLRCPNPVIHPENLTMFHSESRDHLGYYLFRPQPATTTSPAPRKVIPITPPNSFRTNLGASVTAA